ncbi:MAG: phenylacetate--CoA ligase, partial [Clostridiales bacterium]|nr:phenylacetate--CoA ligase [Clostridiales bacterium]
MNNYWDKESECMDRESMRSLQTERLIKAVKYVWDRVPLYHQKMVDAGVKPEDIRTLDDLKYLPFTYKYDLRDTYPFGLFAADREDVVRIHASSGTTGKPTVVGYTRNDINLWANLMARCMTAAGMDKSSVLQVAYGYGLFTGGLGAHYGGECVGASVVPASSGNTKKQIMLMKDFGVTHLACTPSYALYIAEVMAQMGYTPKDFKLKAGIFGAEPWSEALRQEIEEKLGIDAVDIYGMSELMGPGVSCE